MNSTLRRYSIFSFACLAGFAITGCATLQPIHSKPPIDKIVLPAAFTAHSGFSDVVLPAGEYHPLYEDDRFFYYQAPSKVVVNRVFSKIFDGGVYVKRDGTSLRGWYYVDQDGNQNFGRFESEPPHH
jgi:hypothetical protein